MIIQAITLLSAASGFAATPPTLTLTSFRYAGGNTRAAELCGVVTGGREHEHVRVTVDPDTDGPGYYNLFTEQDGRFCVAVVTWTGRAQASVWTTTNELIARDQIQAARRRGRN
jgi:hypothetical protein